MRLRGGDNRQRDDVFSTAHGLYGAAKDKTHLGAPGSAENFTLRPKFRQMFMTALLHATRSTNAWVVTGGTNAGIMKLVGDALGGGGRTPENTMHATCPPHASHG